MLNYFLTKMFDRRTPLKSEEQLRNEVQAHRDALGREIAQRYVRGNVNIKAGRFLTKSDLGAKKIRG